MTRIPRSPAPPHRAFPFLALAAAALAAAATPPPPGGPQPWSLAWSPDGRRIAVADAGAAGVHLISVASPSPSAPASILPVPGQPRAVLWPRPDLLVVAAFSDGLLHFLDPSRPGAPPVRPPLAIGGKPAALAPAGGLLLVADYGRHAVLAIDPATGGPRYTVPVARHPVAVATSPDGRLGISGGIVPDGPATTTSATAVVLFDTADGRILARIALPAGSTNLRGFAFSADGAHAFATHTRGRTALPTTQPDRGWITVNALTVLDVTARAAVATFLLDRPDLGAADPWGVAALPDGRVAVTLAGTGDLVLFDWPRARRLLSGAETLPLPGARPDYADPGTPGYGGTPAQVWRGLATGSLPRSLLAADTAATSGPGLAPRHRVGPPGLRAIALAPAGDHLAALSWFEGALVLADPATGAVRARHPLGPPFAETPARTGERLFHDGTLSFQSWMSCSTCHHEARTDGLNWDLLNDGMGTQKNTKSMLHAPDTPPMTWLGVREEHRLSIAKGLAFYLTQPTPGHIDAISAYFSSLRPEPSPWLVPGPDGTRTLSASALRGQRVFDALDCRTCHAGPLYTDQQAWDVGTGGPEDGGRPYDTPALVEAWRTAPYLHDGSAPDLLAVLTTRNPRQTHGRTTDLSPADLDDLVAYLLSL